MSAAMMLELSEGCELVIDGEPWTVEKLEPYWGSVTLRSGRRLPLAPCRQGQLDPMTTRMQSRDGIPRTAITPSPRPKKSAEDGRPC